MNRVNKNGLSLGARHRENKGREKMNKSETIGALAKALVQAISEMENASKNSVNPHFKSKYADLAEVIATTKPTLQKYGLAVAQFPCGEGGTVGLETVIMHESGEWMSGTAYSPISKQDPQAVGSAITYLRRYSLAAVCGLTQEDDDGNAATRPKAEQKQTQKPQPVKNIEKFKDDGTPLPDSTRKALMQEYGNADRATRLEDANGILQRLKPNCKVISSFSELTPLSGNALLAELKKLKGAA